MATRRTSRNVPPAVPQGEVIADFTQYVDAVAYVEKLVGNNFPAGMIAIVGSDLRSVERVRGRMSYARVAINGAITGSWLGLIYAFIFGPTIDTSNIVSGSNSSMGASIVIGAGIGMLFQVVRFSMTRNKRGFVSQSSMVASKYQIQVPASMVSQALNASVSTEVKP